jgi:hypothetical protein
MHENSSFPFKVPENNYTGVPAVGSENSHKNNNQQDSWWELMYLPNGKSVCSVWKLKSYVLSTIDLTESVSRSYDIVIRFNGTGLLL